MRALRGRSSVGRQYVYFCLVHTGDVIDLTLTVTESTIRSLNWGQKVEVDFVASVYKALHLMSYTPT